jgi:hypothetical protein
VLREDCYRILELPLGSSTDEIKQAYRDLVRVWHPDRFSDERLRQVAEQKLKEINLAYEALLAGTFDSPLEEPPSPEPTPTQEPIVTRNRINPFVWLGIAVFLIITVVIVWKVIPGRREAVTTKAPVSNAPTKEPTASTPPNVQPLASVVSIPEAPTLSEDFVLRMNGAREYVTVPNSFIKLNPEAITVECWVFVESGPGRNMWLLNKGDGGDAYSQRTFDLSWTKYLKIFSFEIFLERGGLAVVRAPEVQNEWIHLAATYDSKTGLLMLHTNGAVAAMTGADFITKASLRGKRIRDCGYGVRIGGAPFDGAFSKGCMDEVRLWTKARSTLEIKREMNQRLTGNEANLCGYWNFDVPDLRQLKNVQVEQNSPKLVPRNSFAGR